MLWFRFYQYELTSVLLLLLWEYEVSYVRLNGSRDNYVSIENGEMFLSSIFLSWPSLRCARMHHVAYQ